MDDKTSYVISWLATSNTPNFTERLLKPLSLKITQDQGKLCSI